jgi:hypothetical protein
VKNLGLAILASLLVHGPATFGVQAEKSVNSSSPPLLVACSPDRPVVPRDGIVVLRAWASKMPRQTFEYKWGVTVGTISGPGREARWDLKGLPSGIYKAEVKVEQGPITAGACSVRVVVTELERGTAVARETGRGFLLKEKPEAAGYGLYSYLLLGSHPTEGTLQRYRTVVQAYLQMIDDVAQFEKELRGKLNVTYLPLGTEPPQAADAPWVLQHYDYARARLLLDVLPGNRKSGIYLVSSLKPLSEGPNPPYLLQDLSTVPTEPPDLISWWIDEFLNQAAQERFWEPKTTELFVLKLRTTISALASGLPEVQQALDKWVAWIH